MGDSKDKKKEKEKSTAKNRKELDFFTAVEHSRGFGRGRE